MFPRDLNRFNPPVFQVSPSVFALPVGGFVLAYSFLCFAYSHSHSSVLLLAASALSAVLLFVTLAGHELGHALVAWRLGWPVTLVSFAGFGAAVTVEAPDDLPPAPVALLAAAGPGFNLAAAAVCWLAGLVVPAAPFGDVLRFAAASNLLFGAASLLPIRPMDGSRVAASGVVSPVYARGFLWGAVVAMFAVWSSPLMAVLVVVAAATSTWLTLRLYPSLR